MLNRPKKIKDFDQFLVELQQIQPAKIVVEASRDDPPMSLRSLASPVGKISERQHAIAYTIEVKGRKRARMYWEPLFKSFQSQWGFADALARNKRIMSVLLAGEKRVAELKGRFPGVEIYLGQGDGTPFPEKTLEALHADAEKHGVSSAI